MTVQEVLEEGKDIEVRKGGHVLRSDKAENFLAGLVAFTNELVVVSREKGAEGRQRR